MNRISQWPDELLLRILSLLPTKDVVVTMLLSKRWQFLWMLVPRLIYNDSYQNLEFGRFSKCVDRSSFMHEAPVTETLRFRLGKICGSGDIQVWIKTAHKCCVRELIIEIVTYLSSKSPVTLPRSLYTCCRMLVPLILSNAVLVNDDVTCPISFPSLKKLSLVSMKYPGGEFFSRLLSSCPVLEDLVVKRNSVDNVAIYNIIVPSLKSLVLYESWDIFVAHAHGFVINASFLELLDVFDYTGGVFVIRNNMPKIVEANAVISCDHPEKILGSIMCKGNMLFLLSKWFHEVDDLRRCWNEPSSVPKCLVSSLETLEWVGYEGTEEEKEVVAVKSAKCLENVTLSLNPPAARNIK